MGYFLVGLGGIFGALLRYLLGIMIPSIWSHSFPMATLIINLSGCFLLGWFTTYLFQLKILHPHIVSAIGTGFVGAFTTFSTFSVETVQLITSQKWGFAITYIFISFFGGLLFTGMGYQSGSAAWNRRQKATLREEN